MGFNGFTFSERLWKESCVPEWPTNSSTPHGKWWSLAASCTSGSLPRACGAPQLHPGKLGAEPELKTLKEIRGVPKIRGTFLGACIKEIIAFRGLY